MSDESGTVGPPAPPFPPPAKEPEPGASDEIDAGAQQPQLGNVDEPADEPDDEPGLTLIERIEALEGHVEDLLGAKGGDHAAAGLTDEVKQHIDAEVGKIRTEVSNITAKVGRAVGIDLQA